MLTHPSWSRQTTNATNATSAGEYHRESRILDIVRYHEFSPQHLSKKCSRLGKCVWHPMNQSVWDHLTRSLGNVQCQLGRLPCAIVLASPVHIKQPQSIPFIPNCASNPQFTRMVDVICSYFISFNIREGRD